MIYRDFKNGDEKLSLLGLGCMRLPKLQEDGDEIDYEKAQQLVDLAIAGGVNYFDTAFFYHGKTSEKFVGQALAKYPRSSYYLATKMPVSLLETAEDMPRFFEGQLADCQTDYFDFYLCHAFNGKNFEKAEALGLYAFLQEMKQTGKIRHIGFSFHDKPAVLQKIAAAHPWEFAQLQINALDWDIYQSKEQYEILDALGIPCIVMEPVKGGRLADLGDEANRVLHSAAPGASIASWFMRYAGGLPNVLTVLSGMSTLEQVQDNLATFGSFTPLTLAEEELLQKALALYRQNNSIGCTACRYCMPCPVGVDIPGVFALFNQAALHDGMEDFAHEYEDFPAESKAGQCIECGQCVAVCPQQLDIPALLQKLEAGISPV